MAKRKSTPGAHAVNLSPKLKSKPPSSLFDNATPVRVEIRPEDQPFMRLLDSLAAMADYDPETERLRQQQEADRQLDYLAGQLSQSHQRELDRREKVRQARLEREEAEKKAQMMSKRKIKVKSVV